MNALIFSIQRFSLHDGQGIRTTVFFKGCNLRCSWCANPESLSLQPEIMNGKEIGKYYTIEEVMHEVTKDKPFYEKSGGGVTLSGGEPLLQPEFVMELCDALHAADINVGIETAANVPNIIFSEVLKKCDFALIDLKHWDRNAHCMGTGFDNEQILSNILYLLKQDIPVTIRIPIIPDYNDTTADAHGFAALLKNLGAKDIHLLPFHQLGEAKYDKLNKDYLYKGRPQMHEEDLKEYAAVLSSYGFRVQIGG